MLIIFKRTLLILFSIILTSLSLAEPKKTIYIVPIEGQISQVHVYILRRAIKTALENNVHTLALSINTPGGEMHSMLEIMELLKNFNHDTLAFISNEALSAGAYITAATDTIYMHPNSVIGSAAVIQGTGEDIPNTLKTKINSFLRAKTRQISQDHKFRSDVLRAMLDDQFELSIDGKLLKPKGELLTLTAQEAIQTFGTPPQPLFAQAITNDISSTLDLHFGPNNYQSIHFKLTTSEYVAKYLISIRPILLGIAMLCLILELKLGSFGILGSLAVCLFVLVFISSSIAGLAGYEGLVAFLFGVLLIILEFVFAPGLFFFTFLGLVIILGAVLWSIADIWPLETTPINFETFSGPLLDLFLFLRGNRMIRQ